LSREKKGESRRNVTETSIIPKIGHCEEVDQRGFETILQLTRKLIHPENQKKEKKRDGRFVKKKEAGKRIACASL